MRQRIWREALNDYLVRLNQTEVPEELGPLERLYAHTQATDPERFQVATVPAPGGGADRGVRVGGDAWPDLVPVDAVRAARGAGRRASAGPSSSGSCPVRITTDRWRRRSTASSRSRTALYARYGIAPRLDDPRPARRRQPARGIPGAAQRDRRGAVRIRRRRTARRGPGIGSWPRRSTRSIASCSGRTTRVDHRYLRAENRAGVPVPRAGRRAPGLRLCRRGRPDRPDRGPRRGAARSDRRPSARGRRRAALGRVDARARRRLPSTLLAAGLRIDGFPLCSAGTARSRTSRDTCPSRRACSMRAVWRRKVVASRQWLPRSCRGRRPQTGARPVRSPTAEPTYPGSSAGRRPDRPATPRSAGPRPSTRSTAPSSSSTTSPRPTRTARRALRDVDLVVPEGDFVFLVGPSGAGKSTLIKLLIRDEVATLGRGHPRRPRPRPAAAPAASRGPPQDRDRLPGLQAAADQDRPREHRVRARGDRHAAARGSAPRSIGSWPSSG